MNSQPSGVWASLEQAREYLAASHGAVLRLMISMAANPQPQPGWIRFRLMESESGQREPQLWWEDVIAICRARTRDSEQVAARSEIHFSN